MKKILLLVKAHTFREVKQAALNHGIQVHDVARNGGNLGEFRAITDEENFIPAQRWFHEPSECKPKTGYPIGTLLFFRIQD